MKTYISAISLFLFSNLYAVDTLRIYAYEGGSGWAGSTFQVWATNDFDEMTVTWNNMPPKVKLLAEHDYTADDEWYKFWSPALDAYIDSVRNYGEQPRFRVQLREEQLGPSNITWLFWAKEHGSLIPTLVIDGTILTTVGGGDALVYERYPDDNYGANNYIWVCNYPSPRRQASFLEFPIPVGVEERKGDSELFNCSPNPFSFMTQISYSMKEKKSVKLSIYDIAGKCVKTLVNEIQSPGYHTISWNRKAEDGQLLPSGIYLVNLKLNNRTFTKKLIIF